MTGQLPNNDANVNLASPCALGATAGEGDHVLQDKRPPSDPAPTDTETDTDSDSGSSPCMQEFRQLVPNGLRVGRSQYGFAIFATAFFPKGSVLYQGQQVVIPDKYAQFRLVLENNEECTEFVLNTDTHSVKFSETERWLYLFDSFTNHSCDPTTCSHQTDELRANNLYDTVALKDIHAGDEITSDYNLFEYDCHGKEIEKCLCGSPNCVQRVAGFRYLSREEQQSRIAFVDQEVLQSMASDPSNKFLFIQDLRCPEDLVRVEKSDSGSNALSKHGSYKIVAARAFKCGEVLYRIDSLVFPDDHALIVEVCGDRKWIDNLAYTVSLGNGTRWFSYFDTFQNHSCDPNTEQVYLTDTAFEMRATRDIDVGEEITSDYESFDEGLDGTSFECKCGSEICRLIIKA